MGGRDAARAQTPSGDLGSTAASVFPYFPLSWDEEWTRQRGSKPQADIPFSTV